MKKISLICLLVFLIGCSVKKDSKTNFVDFVNSGKTTMQSDSDVIKDKMFSLQIPNFLILKRVTTSDYFLHELKFNNNQRVVTLYIPDIIIKIKNNSTDCDYNEFKSYLKELNIEYALDDIKFIKNRRFGLKMIDDNFIIMFINVKNENVKDYQYCINSLTL